MGSSGGLPGGEEEGGAGGPEGSSRDRGEVQVGGLGPGGDTAGVIYTLTVMERGVG